MRIYIPFCLMVTFNAIVLSRLRKSKRKVQNALAVNHQQSNKPMSNKEYRFTIATIVIDFTFLVFYTPMAVNLSFGIVDIVNSAIWSDPLSDVIVHNLFSTIAQLLAFAYSVAMIFFFIIFNRLFRHELFDLMRIRCFFSLHSSENNTSIHQN